MASTSSNSARTYTLNTTELLENILLHLPPAATIRCRQVHPSWKDTIAASPQLRQHIFLDPKPVTELLVTRMADDLTGLILTLSRDLEDLETDGHPIVSLHPALRPRQIGPPIHGRDTSAATWFEIDAWRIRAAPDEWRRMFVTNPPASKITVELSYRNNVTIQYDGGVTMGVFFDKVLTESERPLAISWGLVGRVSKCVLESSYLVEQARNAAKTGDVEDLGSAAGPGSTEA